VCVSIMSTEKFSYKNILIQHRQEEKKRDLINMISQNYVRNNISGEFIFVLEVEGDNYYFENHFCTVCGNFTRIGPHKYYDEDETVPASIVCLDLEHQSHCGKVKCLDDMKYHSKEHLKLTYIREALLGEQRFQRIMFQCEFLQVQRQRLHWTTIAQRYSSTQRIWTLEAYTRTLSNYFYNRDFHTLELQKYCFEYQHCKLLLVHPWVKDMIYEYLEGSITRVLHYEAEEEEFEID
jgi:hypothetical protein